MMADREKVVKGLQNLRDAIATDFIHEADQAVATIDDALDLLKEQEAVKPRISSVEQRCGNCNKIIEMDGWVTCPWCGKQIDWEGWWSANA